MSAGLLAAAPVAGLVADAVAGDPRRAHPVALFGAAADRCERALWRDSRASGVAHTAATVLPVVALVALIDRRLRRRGRGLLLAAVTWAALGGRSLGTEALAIADAVDSGDLATARARLPALVGRDPRDLDGPELCRAVVESVAENTADAVVAPLTYAVAGPAAVVAHRCVNTLDAMVGHRGPRYGRFGWAAARSDDALGFLPARVTAGLAALLAPAVGGASRAAIAVVRRDGARHPSPNAGPCEAAFAGALGVRLGGVNCYGDRVEHRGPHGDGPTPGPADVRRAVRLSRLVGVAAGLLAVVVRLALAGRRP